MAIPYGKQEITQNDIDAVVEALTSDFLTQGPKIIEFEESFAKYVNAKYAVAVSNGTAALHCATIALGVNKKSNILCSPNSFVASSNAVLFCGGKVTFSDINPENFCLDLDLLELKIKRAPLGTYTGIVVVDFAGYPVDTERLGNIAKTYNLWIIEDACHAPGASFINSEGNKINLGDNSYSDITVFSFHPVKHIACGEGGIITTNSEEIYHKLLLARSHGVTKKNMTTLSESDGNWYYEMQELGYNYRITDIQCALGLSQLSRARDGVKKRQEVADFYNQALADLPILLPKVEEGKNHAYHLYVVRTNKRKELYEFLRTKDIYTQIHYIPICNHPYYKNSERVTQEEFPNASKYYSECLSLPMYPSIKEEELKEVVNALKEFYNQKN
jgi:UDP-4-amino-4,6-dideoxy-N-acetyl-beta-L-altrosamine transaminase